MINRKLLHARRDERARLDDDLDPAPTSGTRAMRPQTAPSTNPSVASQLTELHAKLELLNHFEVLGLPETADRQNIRRAFEQRARRFHPDRLGSNDEHLRPLAAKVFLRMAEAYRVLGNEPTRTRYLSSLRLHNRRNPRP